MAEERVNIAELRAKAEKANSPEELMQMAQIEGIALTPEEAERVFTVLNQKGELADDELENVAGGACMGEHLYGYKPEPLAPRPLSQE
jgi:predicted ribosomally synthesized peptide with nif11-like leader